MSDGAAHSSYRESDLQNEISQSPVPMLYGPPSVVDGWCGLELKERDITAETLSNFGLEIALWYSGLGLLVDGLTGTRSRNEVEETEVDWGARVLATNLMSLSVSSAKSALDMTLAGNYSIALASVRHMIETVVQVWYVRLFPEKYLDWYADGGGKAPPMKQMVDQITSRLKRSGINDKNSVFDSLYSNWRLSSKGSHPSGAGLLQILPVDSDEMIGVGPTYKESLVVSCFDLGLWALYTSLKVLPGLEIHNSTWDERYKQWNDRWNLWRTQFNERLIAKGYLDPAEVSPDE